MSDQIILDGMQVMACVGVTLEEQSRPQLLEISLILHLDLNAAGHADRLTLSVDYAEVQRKTIEAVHQRPRCLIETVAEDVAQNMLGAFKLRKVEVEVRKFILEHTRGVAVRVTREGR